ncbi:PP2C family protein-serine/threonine phosphatase [Nocardiopsis sp. ATB16-24]|uniref:PP2C family protein-serine/threonine phosphatase n=1 Tax=Nocardiopsis sp. ATB16-24 TaxID=3019555 RepID=UPI002554E2D8|nr:PP2C family protein-serine/threonine phosphatase [Nocardiopsis sp. ATB16-24]
MKRFERGRFSTVERAARWVPSLLLLAVIVIELLSPATNTFPLLAAVPVAAAPLVSLAWTFTGGAAALALGSFFSYLHGGGSFGRPELISLVTIGVLTLVAAFLNRIFAHERARLRTLREVAEAVQFAVLPLVPERVGDLTVAARYRSAQKEALIGGDLYAVHDTPHGVRFVIGDVRGKGMRAVSSVNTLLGSFQAGAYYLEDLSEIVRGLDALMQNFPGTDSDTNFVTAIIAEVSSDHSVLRMANRGHPAPLMVHEGTVTALEPKEPSLPLGLGHLAEPDDVPMDWFELPPGATLVMFTDGVTEAQDRNGVFFDPVPPLARPLPPNPTVILDTLLTALARHTDDLGDDTAVLVITRDPADHSGDSSRSGHGAVAHRPSGS